MTDALERSAAPSRTARAPTHRRARPDLDAGRRSGASRAAEGVTGARRRDAAAATWRGGCARRAAEVVTLDPAPGMQPDVICRAEDLPFADGSFDVVACRDRRAPLRRSARRRSARWRASQPSSSSSTTTLYLERGRRGGRAAPRPDARAQLLRGRVARRSSSRPASRSRQVERFEKRVELEPWLERAGCDGDEAARVRELLADRIERRQAAARPHDRLKARKAGG